MRPLVCAHRGASAYHPDNSRAAFEAAIAMGAEMVETDVRRAPDGRLVLAHDPLGPEDDVDALLTLDDLVAQAAGRIALDVELKEPGCEVDALAALAARPPGLVVTSFLPDVVGRLRALAPDVRVGLLVDEAHGGDHPLEQAAACGAHVLAPHRALADRELRAHALAAGVPLAVWTVNDPAELRELAADPAVAALITDVPDVALTVRAAVGPGPGARRRAD